MVIDEYRKKLKVIKVDDKFYVRREEDSKIYRNMIKVHSEGFTTFTTGHASDEVNFKKIEEIYQLVKKITKS